MKDQLNLTTTESNPVNKKVWQTPSIEIISRDIINSGSVAGATEGGPTPIRIDNYSHS